MEPACRLAGPTSVGLAYGPSIPEFIESNPGLVNHLELPFEQLRHTPELASLQGSIPIILHCASLSVAGFSPPAGDTVEDIDRIASSLQSPWIGEHLAFTRADGLDTASDSSGAPIELSYTVCPQLSDETVNRVAANLDSLEPRLRTPLILENSPQYFVVPGSTMSMTDFIRAVMSRCNVGMLLDLSHFLITMQNTGADPQAELERLPLERLVEVHISGMNTQSGVVWDDHSTPAPAAVFELLERVLERVRPRAVTLEYNWSPRFPGSFMLTQLERVHELLGEVG